ncbi:cupin domain-containing protein [Streptomyces sp. SID8379]|uniref:cupin domain-containing protein n=1 Tax=Streptomyces sp. SID8379 TaxID=2690359 RepID=UPI000475EADD|nr:cupin domain-containing protein [Streptomyces sp. HmicA12]MYW69371.1 cupin domain-containing protein [Streptomyces sp. SID8379]MYW69394.1 cupin domain-containing protein [Streptomyces sp. SID8379]
MVSAAYDGFPGAVGVSRLRVYDWPTVEGLPGGGTPHLHLACSEGYVVTAGRGRVQTLTLSGYEETALEPGTVAWFTPGTIHRLVNDGALEITVVMQNSGLPEAGDAVLTLPQDLLDDPDTYADAVRIPDDVPEAEQVEIARARRDLATRRFLELRAATEAGDPAPLEAFQQAAAALIRPRLDAWEQRWRDGAQAAASATGAQLHALRGQHTEHLAHARVAATGPTARGRFGMCGRLDVYPGI